MVDDASDSPAEEVVDRVAGSDPRVVLQRLQSRAGAAAARNTAFAQAQGEIVGFIDDDDEWQPRKLELQMSFLRDHPSVGIVTGDFEIHYEQRTTKSSVLYRGPNALTARHLLWFNLPGSFICGMVRRDAAGDELWLDTSFPAVEDWDLWVRCSRCTNIGVVKENLGRIHLHGEGRLSDPASERTGLQAFERRHQAAMSKACREFLHAHQRMEEGAGWRKRVNVLRSIATPSAQASALVLLEQVARQWGKARRDPGFVERALVKVLPV